MNDIIAFSELGPFIDQPIKTYSSGMRSRLGFSIGMELAPDVLLIDEVLGVGDWRFQQKASDALYHKIGNGRTVVLVSHDLNQVEELCTRVVWIEHGQTQAVGDTVDVIQSYKDRFQDID
jgi:ABC-type polysaccharide/polyol phosphate transport system ATPase subunit